jgi:hypothetical protein
MEDVEAVKAAIEGGTYRVAQATANDAAIAGTETNPCGINGSFTFTVSLTCGVTTLTATVPTGVIIATSYNPVEYDNTLHGVSVNSQPLNISDNMLYVMPCGASEAAIVLETADGATSNTGRMFTEPSISHN